MVKLLIGNASPLMADGSAAEIGNTITEVTMAPYYNDAEQAELALSTSNDRVLSMIARYLQDEERMFALGIADVESLWSSHSGDLPEWVECDEDPAFAAVLSNHFTNARHECSVGRPDGWED